MYSHICDKTLSQLFVIPVLFYSPVRHAPHESSLPHTQKPTSKIEVQEMVRFLFRKDSDTVYWVLFTGAKLSLFSTPTFNSENFKTVNIYFT